MIVTEKQTIPEKVINLNFILQVALYKIDELAGTPLYRHTLKNKLKSCEEEIRKYIDKDSQDMFEENESQSMGLLKNLDSIATSVGKLRLEDYATINEGINNYIKEVYG
jgi:hypothetical protein